jgi:hypothetical protein
VEGGRGLVGGGGEGFRRFWEGRGRGVGEGVGRKIVIRGARGGRGGGRGRVGNRGSRERGGLGWTRRV